MNQNLNILNDAIAAVDCSTSRVSSAGTSSRATFTDRNRETINVLAHSIVPASGGAGTIGEICARLGVALVEPQHPVGSSFGKETTVGLAISAAVANAVEVALP
jgi:hypothetical protein